MEYTNEMLMDMDNLRCKNKQFSNWLARYASDTFINGLVDSGFDIDDAKDTYDDFFSSYLDGKKNYDYDSITDASGTIAKLNRSSRLFHCLDWWEFDRYDPVKILDLQRVNRCKDRFCPNCKRLENSKYIHKITDVYTDYLKKGYHFYFLTLTIPSIKTLEPSELRDCIDRLYANFCQFKNMYSYSIDDKRSYSDRLVTFAGGIRVLEITHNYKAGFHPHLHCIIATESEILPDLLNPKYRAKYSRKRKAVDFKNDIECQIAKIWTLINYNMYSVLNMERYDYDPQKTHPIIDGVERLDMKNLEVDFRPLDEDGFRETFKYTVKSSEINSYNVFRCLYYSLYRRRIRQGFGIFYRLKIDDCIDDDGDLQLLPDECDGIDPDVFVVQEMKRLYTEFSDYKKISRYNAAKNIVPIPD